MSTTKKNGRDTFRNHKFVRKLKFSEFKTYPFAQHKRLLGPLAFESHPKEKGDGEGDKGHGKVHVGDGDVLPNHWPEKKLHRGYNEKR